MFKKYPLAVGMFFAGLMAFSYASSKGQMCHVAKGNVHTSVKQLEDGFVFTLTGKNAQEKKMIKEALEEKARQYQSRFPYAAVTMMEDGAAVSLIVKGIPANAPMCPYKSKRKFQSEKSLTGTDNREVSL